MSKDTKAVPAVMAYLTAQNRPFSANDVVVGLKTEFSKTVVQKALDQLASEGKIIDKTCGKQHIYVLDQSNLPTLDESEFRTLEAEARDLKAKLREKVERIRQLEHDLKGLSNTLPLPELKRQLAECEEKLSVDSERLAKVKSSSGPQIPAADRDKLAKKLQVSVREWRKRKAIVNEMMNTILESYPKSKADFKEEVGIEDDGGLEIPKV